MDPALFHSLVDTGATPVAMSSKASIVLEQARWAAMVFDRYDRAATMRIVDAVAEAAHAGAGEFAEKVVAESGFGVVAHKKLKNELTAKPLIEYYRQADYVNPRVDEAAKIVEIPRPAGVIFALTPSTNPVATINYKILLALMTRNAIVISPHPAVKTSSVEAVCRLAEAAEAAGAPSGIIQPIKEPSMALIEAFMHSDKIDLILATGGSGMVRSAYSSGNPALGVGPGNAPVFVDDSADLTEAARHIVASKSFDNSVLCTNESVLVTLRALAEPLKRALKSAKAHICSEQETEILRRFLFHSRGFNVAAIGRDACWIAQECGFSIAGDTRILVAPIANIGIEEPLAKEKLCPVLALHHSGSTKQAIIQSRAVLRLAGAGHSAAIHSQDEATIMDYASSVEAYRVVVNAPCSQGAAGFATNLAPAFTLGTGFFGRSARGENIGPQHLIEWTRIAYNSGDGEPFGNYQELGRRFRGALPAAPADGVPGSTQSVSAMASLDPAMREELQRLIAAELKELLNKHHD